jgi:toluene monooxygenase system ferredoxin subunit
MTWSKVTTLDELWEGEMKSVVVERKPVLLVNVDGKVCAYEDRCLHKGVRLSEGRLAGRLLTCSAHEWQYDAATGRGVNPANVELVGLAVRIEGDDVFVDVCARAHGSQEPL